MGEGTKKPTEKPRLRSSHGAPPKKKSSKPGREREARAPREPSAGKAAAPAARRPTLPTKTALTPKTGLGLRKPARAAGTEKREKAPAAAGPSIASDGARELAVTIAVCAIEKKAVGIEILDVAGRVDYADFLVLMSGRSDRQVGALAQSIEEAVKKKGKRALSVEGMPHASWVLMDFGDVVVHVFQEDARNLYDIEGLWMDARRLPVPIPDEGPAPR